MDYTSLKEITETIISIIQAEVDPSKTVNVLPELLRNNDNGVGFYLYHVQESSHYKNYPAYGSDSPPVNYAPMALNLFYQLSPNWKINDKEDAIEEQKLMSTAMKAIHDNSVIRKTIPMLPDFPNGKDIDIKITLLTLTPSESVQYWAAAESPVRLSAYYEVSVIFLEPEKATSYSGRVLSYGNYIFVQGAPKITESKSIIEYSLPGDPEIRQVEIKPAQAPFGNAVSFMGTGFNRGTQVILIKSPLWDKPAAADAAWNLQLISENQIDITIQTNAVLQGTATSVDILPGMYSARVSIKELKTLPNGTVKEFNHLSNQFPFSVMPRIDSITEAAGIYTVTGYVFEHADIKTEEVQIYIGDTLLNLKSGAVLAAGEFEVTNFDTIKFSAPSGLPSGPAAMRVMINGIESAPNWIDIP